MCKKCGHDAADLCSCEPVRESKIAEMFFHLFNNITDEVWELDYTDLGLQEYRRLCLVGVCRECGGRLCLNIGSSENLAGKDFLAATYQRLRRFYRSDWRFISEEEFWNRFIQMFHEQDRSSVLDSRKWLENQCGEEIV